MIVAKIIQKCSVLAYFGWIFIYNRLLKMANILEVSTISKEIRTYLGSSALSSSLLVSNVTIVDDLVINPFRQHSLRSHLFLYMH